MLGVYGLGFWIQQAAFQSGEAVVAIGVMVAATNAVPIAAGLAAFGDPPPRSPPFSPSGWAASSWSWTAPCSGASPRAREAPSPSRLRACRVRARPERRLAVAHA